MHHLELVQALAFVPLTSSSHAFYDACNRVIINVEHGSQIVKIDPFARTSGNPEKETYRISHREKIIDAKISLDGAWLAVQCNNVSVEFIHLTDSNKNFTQFCKKHVQNRIIGYHWTSTESLFFVTTNGLELYQFPLPPPKKSKPGRELKLLKEHKLEINWFCYSAKHRVLLACVNENTLQGFHFLPSTQTIIKIPKFTIPKDTNPLKQGDITVCQIYNKLYCIFVDPSKREMALYELTKESVTLKKTYDLLSSGVVAIQVVDNLLIVHSLDTKVAMVFDIRDKDNEYPIASPLPLCPVVIVPNYDDNKNEAHGEETDPYQRTWYFQQPNIIIDVTKGRVWELSVNLAAITAGINDPRMLVEFLMRRTHPRSKTLLLQSVRNCIIEQESLSTLSEVFDILNYALATYNGVENSNTENPKESAPSQSNASSYYERASITLKRIQSLNLNVPSSPPQNSNSPYMSRYFSSLAKSGVDSFDEWSDASNDVSITSSEPEKVSATTAVAQNMMHTYFTAQQLRPARKIAKGITIVDQADMYRDVFLPIEESPGINYKYIVAVLIEYLRSLHFNHTEVEPFFYELLINFLVTNKRFYQLHQLLQLLSLEGTYPPAYQLALDMLKRLHTHEEILEVLLSKEQLIPALRFLRMHRNLKVQPARFLEAASKTNSALFYTVYQFFEQRAELNELGCAPYVEHFRKTFGKT